MEFFGTAHGGWLTIGILANLVGFALVLVALLRQFHGKARFSTTLAEGKIDFGTVAAGVVLLFAGLPFQIVGTALAVSAPSVSTDAPLSYSSNAPMTPRCLVAPGRLDKTGDSRRFA